MHTCGVWQIGNSLSHPHHHPELDVRSASAPCADHALLHAPRKTRLPTRLTRQADIVKLARPGVPKQDESLSHAKANSQSSCTSGQQAPPISKGVLACRFEPKRQAAHVCVCDNLYCTQAITAGQSMCVCVRARACVKRPALSAKYTSLQATACMLCACACALLT